MSVAALTALFGTLGASTAPALTIEDMLSTPGSNFQGLATDQVGTSVSRAGDVNGDGRPDIIVSGWHADPNGLTDAGSAYVVYGSDMMPQRNYALGALAPQDGFAVNGAGSGDVLGSAVSAAGDVNGDGIDDLLVGAPRSDQHGTDSGSAVVVFGSRDQRGRVDVAALTPADGYRIDGAAAGDYAGTAVAPAGDVDGDGLADMLIGSPRADNNGSNSGSVYLVRGSDSRADVSLATLGSRGYRFDGAVSAPVGTSVASAGDFDSDGHPDIVVGAPEAGENGRARAGTAYLIRTGAALGSRVMATMTSAQGVRFQGAAAGQLTGVSVAGAGDVNGDGRKDVVIGATDATVSTDPGRAYVIFGNAAPATIDLAAIPTGAGMRIDGATGGDHVGGSVGNAGDMSGDGRSDVVLGAKDADYNGRTNSGTVYVVYGSGSTDSVNLATMGDGAGYRIDGPTASDRLGASVSGVGDLDDDGINDMLVGAPSYSGAQAGSGIAYVLWGSVAPAPPPAPAPTVTPVPSASPVDTATPVPSASPVDSVTPVPAPVVFIPAPSELPGPVTVPGITWAVTVPPLGETAPTSAGPAPVRTGAGTAPGPAASSAKSGSGVAGTKAAGSAGGGGAAARPVATVPGAPAKRALPRVAVTRVKVVHRRLRVTLRATTARRVTITVTRGKRKTTRQVRLRAGRPVTIGLSMPKGASRKLVLRLKDPAATSVIRRVKVPRGKG